MQTGSAIVVIALAVSSLAACQKPTAAEPRESSTTAPPVEAEAGPDRAPAAVAPSADAAAPVADRAAMAQVSAEVDCVAATAKEVGVEESRVVLEKREGQRLHMRVPGAEGPWFCELDAQGKVAKVLYSGVGEGAL